MAHIKRVVGWLSGEPFDETLSPRAKANMVLVINKNLDHLVKYFKATR